MTDFNELFAGENFTMPEYPHAIPNIPAVMDPIYQCPGGCNNTIPNDNSVQVRLIHAMNVQKKWSIYDQGMQLMAIGREFRDMAQMIEVSYDAGCAPYVLFGQKEMTIKRIAGFDSVKFMTHGTWLLVGEKMLELVQTYRDAWNNSFVSQPGSHGGRCDQRFSLCLLTIRAHNKIV